jgi:hypothetical protein
VIPLFWRHLRTPSRIPFSALLVLFAAILIVAPPSGARAQASSSLSGIVPDPADAPIANVSVAAANRSTSLARLEIAGPGAAYKFSLLPPGDDRMMLTATGFKTADIVNISETAHLNQVKASEPTPATAPSPDALTWHGITLYGAYDVGIGWVSHGLPQSPYNYEGSTLVNRNANHSRFLVEPDNLSQTGLGIRGREQFAPGWSVVFNASTGINPQSGQLSNASRTDIDDNGLPRSGYSEAIDGARAGQPLNDEYYGGISSTNFGTLTFGRQRALGTDTMLLYDPVAGGSAR